MAKFVSWSRPVRTACRCSIRIEFLPFLCLPLLLASRTRLRGLSRRAEWQTIQSRFLNYQTGRDGSYYALNVTGTKLQDLSFVWCKRIVRNVKAKAHTGVCSICHLPHQCKPSSFSICKTYTLPDKARTDTQLCYPFLLDFNSVNTATEFECLASTLLRKLSVWIPVWNKVL